MRNLIFALALLVLAVPAMAAPTVVKIDKKHELKINIDLRYSMTSPEYMNFTIGNVSTKKVLVETKGDPIIVLAGVQVGLWPYKHLTYRLPNGIEITGHADKPNGNVHTIEIYHTDGTLTRILYSDTPRPIVKKYGKWHAWLWKKAHKKPTFTIELD